MSWTRAELKSRAKVAFYRNYWKCVLVAFVLLMLGGGSGSTGASVPSDSASYEEYNNNGIYHYNNHQYNTPKETTEDVVFVGLMVFIVMVCLTAAIIGSLIGLFVFNPLQVGSCHYFLQNAVSNDAEVGALIKAFKTNYKNTVLTMFLRGLYTVLWTLLFIIPGIIKGYEYRMIPYILADHPEMNHQEAFTLSQKMMDGEKWNTFILDWSFFGWQLLNAFTLGILGIFYVNPYVHATSAELYLTLKHNKCSAYNPYQNY